MKKIVNLLTVIGFIISTTNFAFAAQNYQLEKVLILSRHNLRAPFVEKTSEVSQVTPYNWYNWQVKAGELSMKGALLETAMGQYFRLYFAKENFFTENYIPKKNETRFYANSFQRTIATAKNFSAGLFPVANIEVEHKFGINESDAVFLGAKVKKFSKDYSRRLNEEKESSGGENKLQKKLSAYVRTTEKVLDFKNSSYAKKNHLQNFSEADFTVGQNPYVEGNLRLAMNASDALMMQYYEGNNLFGKNLSETDLKNIADAEYFGINLIFEWSTWAKVHTNPMLNLMRDELSDKDRKFTFLCGHDLTVAMVLSALDVELCNLPDSIEKMTPLGVKFVVEKRLGDDGQTYAKTNLVYQSTKQIKDVEILDLRNPPQIFPLKFKNLQTNEDGLYLYSDFEERLNQAIAEYDLLVEK